MENLADACVAFKAFSASVGRKAYVGADLNLVWSGKGAITCVLYPGGIGSDKDRTCLRSDGNTFAEALEALKAAWEAHQDTRTIGVTKAMALAIIRLTTELGECSDAALRAEFEPNDVARYGGPACELANEMAGRGPFSIIATSGANDREAA